MQENLLLSYISVYSSYQPASENVECQGVDDTALGMEYLSHSSRKIHKPLDAERKEMRLLRFLHPLSYEDSQNFLRCSFEVVFLNDRPKYIGLSCEWARKAKGSTPPIRCIINDAEIHPTHNLSPPLTALRKIPLETRHWIDAICINQTDVEEREY